MWMRPKAQIVTLQYKNCFPCLQANTLTEFCKSYISSDLKLCLCVDKRPKHTEKAMFFIIPVYLWTWSKFMTVPGDILLSKGPLGMAVSGD